MIAERFCTDHHEFVVEPHALEIMPKLARHYGEPFADPSAIPSFYLAELTSHHVTVALNGDGGDESFAGYTRYVSNDLVAHLDWLPRPLQRLAPRLVNRLAREATTEHSARGCSVSPESWRWSPPPATRIGCRPSRARMRGNALQPAFPCTPSTADDREEVIGNALASLERLLPSRADARHGRKHVPPGGSAREDGHRHDGLFGRGSFAASRPPPDGVRGIATGTSSSSAGRAGSGCSSPPSAASFRTRS